MSENLDSNQAVAKRPAFLTVLCILSFIAAGFSIIGGLLLGLGKGAVEASGGSTEISTNMEGISTEGAAAIEAVNAAFSWPYMITSMVLVIVGLIGVIKMWKLQKSGFYIYVGTAVAGIILPLVFGMAFAVFGTVITIGFIVMYGLNLKHMK